MIKVSTSNSPWLYREERRKLWENLKHIKDTYNHKWLIGGYFNELLNNSEKRGGRPICRSRTKELWNVLNYCELLDLGFQGSNFAWWNKRFKDKSKLIRERLDRFLATDDWIYTFPDAHAKHLSQTHSDHCPLLLSLKRFLAYNHEKIFRFESMWATHPEVENVIKRS